MPAVSTLPSPDCQPLASVLVPAPHDRARGAIPAFAPRAAPDPARPRPERAGELRARWARLTDTHQFLALVRKLKTNRLGAYRSVGAPMAEPLAPGAVSDLLHGAALAAVELMILVGNAGCIQIHSGPVERIVPKGPWLNVMDPRFNLHLRADRVAEVWRIEKPARHGPALSVEAFDAEGRLICQVFGRRGEGLPAWEALARSPPAPAAAPSAPGPAEGAAPRRRRPSGACPGGTESGRAAL